MIERFKGKAWGGWLAMPALLLTQDISCSKSIAAPGSVCCYALLLACHVQTLQVAAPIFAKFGSAFSGFYLLCASKLS